MRNAANRNMDIKTYCIKNKVNVNRIINKFYERQLVSILGYQNKLRKLVNERKDITRNAIQSLLKAQCHRLCIFLKVPLLHFSSSFF